jgi:uncharacterized protein YecT (DUF1311 family)
MLPEATMPRLAPRLFPPRLALLPLALAAVLSAQQPAPPPTAQQWFAGRQALQAQARQVFSAEMAREKAGDCAAAQSNYDFKVCYDRVFTLAGASLAAYERIIRDLQAPPPGTSPNASPGSGVEGRTLSPAQQLAAFDKLEASWRQYRDLACQAAWDQFDGGSGAPAFQSECQIRLTRDHLRELDMIYGGLLHL